MQDFVGAIATADQISRDNYEQWERINTQSPTADSYWKINVLSIQATAYCEIVCQQAKAGDIAGAKAILDHIGSKQFNKEVKAEAYRQIAEIQATAGQFAEAIATAAQISVEDYRTMAYENIVRAQIRGGDISVRKRRRTK